MTIEVQVVWVWLYKIVYSMKISVTIGLGKYPVVPGCHNTAAIFNSMNTESYFFIWKDSVSLHAVYCFYKVLYRLIYLLWFVFSTILLSAETYVENFQISIFLTI